MPTLTGSQPLAELFKAVLLYRNLFIQIMQVFQQVVQQSLDQQQFFKLRFLD